jgi:type VI secretion system protein ImpM
MASYGFFGKLPTRGDFVSAGLPRSFIGPWDAWLRWVLPPVFQSLANGWIDAPVWRFRLHPGVCGADPVLGVLLPSMDRVGRFFPLTIACLNTEADTESVVAAEATGHAAITREMAPEMLARLLADIRTERYGSTVRVPRDATMWWTGDDRGGGETSFELPGLPHSGEFVMMLHRNHRAEP